MLNLFTKHSDYKMRYGVISLYFSFCHINDDMAKVDN
jgi:hypothetical protein